MDLPRVEAESLAQITYRHIKDAILRSAFEGRARPLTEAALAAQLGVSKTPVREALQRLALEGFVEIADRRGAYVVGVSAMDVAEAFGVREALESYAMRQGFRRLGSEGLPEFERLVNEAGAAVEDHEAFQRHDRALHALIVEAAGNGRLQKLYVTVAEHVQLMLMRAIDLPGRSARSHLEHLKLLEALRRGAEDLAVDCLVAHIRSVRDDQLRALPALDTER